MVRPKGKRRFPGTNRLSASDVDVMSLWTAARFPLLMPMVVGDMLSMSISFETALAGVGSAESSAVCDAAEGTKVET